MVFFLHALRFTDMYTQRIPDHQFGFRNKHSTIQQVHRLCHTIYTAFEAKQYCTSAFLDVSQAFDNVWHDGLLYKIKHILPLYFDPILSICLRYWHSYSIMAEAQLLAELTETKVELQRLKERISVGTPTIHKDLSLISLVLKWSGSEMGILLEEFLSSIESSGRMGS